MTFSPNTMTFSRVFLHTLVSVAPASIHLVAATIAPASILLGSSSPPRFGADGFQHKSIPVPMQSGQPDAWFHEDLIQNGELGVINVLASTNAMGILLYDQLRSKHRKIIELLPEGALDGSIPEGALPQFNNDPKGVPKPAGKEVFTVPYGQYFSPPKGVSMREWVQKIPADQKWKARVVARFTDTGRLIPPRASQTVKPPPKSLKKQATECVTCTSCRGAICGGGGKKVVREEEKDILQNVEKREEPSQVVQVWLAEDTKGNKYLYVLGQPASDPPAFLFRDGENYQGVGSAPQQQAPSIMGRALKGAIFPTKWFGANIETHDQLSYALPNQKNGDFRYTPVDYATGIQKEEKTVSTIPVKRFDWQLADKIWLGESAPGWEETADGTAPRMACRGLRTWLEENVLAEDGEFSARKQGVDKLTVRFAGFSAGATAAEMLGMRYAAELGNHENYIRPDIIGIGAFRWTNTDGVAYYNHLREQDKFRHVQMMLSTWGVPFKECGTQACAPAVAQWKCHDPAAFVPKGRPDQFDWLFAPHIYSLDIWSKRFTALGYNGAKYRQNTDWRFSRPNTDFGNKHPDEGLFQWYKPFKALRSIKTMGSEVHSASAVQKEGESAARESTQFLPPAAPLAVVAEAALPDDVPRSLGPHLSRRGNNDGFLDIDFLDKPGGDGELSTGLSPSGAASVGGGSVLGGTPEEVEHDTEVHPRKLSAELLDKLDLLHNAENFHGIMAGVEESERISAVVKTPSGFRSGRSEDVGVADAKGARLSPGISS